MKGDTGRSDVLAYEQLLHPGTLCGLQENPINLSLQRSDVVIIMPGVPQKSAHMCQQLPSLVTDTGEN